MKKYTYDEVLSILKETANVPFAFTDADREAILADEAIEPQLASLKAFADVLRDEPTPAIPFSAFRRFETDGDRGEFEGYYFRRRHKLTTFTLLYWLYGRDEDKLALENIIWAILDEYTWSVAAHLRGTGLSALQEDGYMIDLFAAETGEALAEMLSLVGDKLSPIVKMRTERYIAQRILSRATDSFWWNSGCTNNWCAVCSGSVAMCAIYQERDIERLAKILTFYIDVIQNNFYRGFSGDGACLEGLSYWTYGFGYFTYFADLLKKRTAGKIDLFLDEPIKRIALFFNKCFFPGQGSVSFADAGVKASYMPALAAYYSTMYPSDMQMPPLSYVNMSYPQDHCSRFALLLRNFTWAAGKLKEGGEARFTTHLLCDAQWYLSSSENGIGIAAKGGNNAEPHNHNDVGSFHILKNGKQMFADIGCPAYERDYFGKNRYQYFAPCSRAHNLPVINGHYQRAAQDAAAANVVLSDDGIVMDIAAAYAESSLCSLVRDIRFDKVTGTTYLTDTYRFDSTPESVSERFIFKAEPTVGEGCVKITVEGESMMLLYDALLFDARLQCVSDYSHSTFNTKQAEGAVNRERKTYVLDLIVKEPRAELSLSFQMRDSV